MAAGNALIFGLCGFGVGFLYVTLNLTNAFDESVIDASKASYQAGYIQGQLSQNWKELSLRDRKFSTELCNAWWFGVTPLERRGNGRPHKR